MRAGVNYCKQQHRVGELPVHPDVLVKRQKSDLWPNEAHDGSADRKQNEHAVDAQNQTGASRYPDRVFERVEAGQPRVGRLLPPTQFVSALCSNLPHCCSLDVGENLPAIGEYAEVERPKQEVKQQLRWRKLLLQQRKEPHFAKQPPLLFPDESQQNTECRPATGVMTGFGLSLVLAEGGLGQRSVVVDMKRCEDSRPSFQTTFLPLLSIKTSEPQWYPKRYTTKTVMAQREMDIEARGLLEVNNKKSGLSQQL